jgi:hypothetical protein
MEPSELSELKKTRSMLVLLLATCQQTLLALEAAGNVLDTDLTDDLSAMIKRSEAELANLKLKIEAFPILAQPEV